MAFTATPTALPGVIIIEPQVFADERGFFMETYRADAFRDLGVDCDLVQDNHSKSAKGVLRGIHYQDMRAPMAKLVRCTAGSILDVAVDLRVGAPTFGRWVAAEITAANKKQFYVPVGFGHAFLALEEGTEVQYRCSAYYAPETEGNIAWDDPDIAVDWPIREPVLSARDQQGKSLRAYLEAPAFRA